MFKMSFKVKIFALVLFFLSSAVVGCLPKSEKYEIEPIKMPEVPEIKLPSGDLLTGLPDVHIDDAVWAEEVRGRAQSCVESLCSIPSTTYFELEDEGYLLQQAEIDELPQAHQIFETEIWPKMLNFIEEDRTVSKNQLVDLLNFYEMSPVDSQFNVTEFTASYIRFLYSQNLLTPYAADDFDYDFLVSDKELRLKEAAMNRVPDDQKADVTLGLKILSRLIYSDAYQNARLIEKHGLRTFLLYNYKTDIVTAKRQFVSEINESLDAVGLHLPILANQIKGSVGFSKLLAGEDMLPVEESDVASTYQTSLMLSSFLNEPWQELADLSLDIDSLVDRSSIIDSIKQMIARDSDERFQASRDKAHEICKQSLAAHLGSRPTAAQIDTFSEAVETIKQEAKLQANQLYPNQQPSIQQMIDSANFLLPTTQDGALREIRDSVQFLVDGLEELADMKSLSPIDAQNVGGMLVGSYRYSFDGEDDSFQGLSDMCLKYLPKGLVDHTYTFENKVVVSTNTVKTPQAGAAIVAHELGHRVQAELGKPGRAGLNQCLVDRHFSGISQEGDQSDEGLNQFFDEDFADNFSTKIMVSLDMTEKENNLGCLLFGSANESAGRVNYFGSNTVHPLVINNTDDVHAASLHRLLQVAHDFGSTTQICKDFYTEEKKNIYFVNGTKIITIPEIKTCH